MADARVSHYRIVRQLGAGGMGVVYEAVDEHSGRTVVIKAIKEERPDPDAVRRFEREGRAAAAVKHENVVQLFDAGVAPNGYPFLVFELVPGGSLSERLKRDGPLPWREAATVGAAVARGLGAIHRAGLVHRDMKPANVMLAADGTPKIGDLGLVRADAASGLTKGGLTKTGELMGTLEYVAPEQAEGSRAIDARTDLYSFGATLHALIAGRPPFEGAGFVLVKKHLLDAPPALSSIIDDVPPAFEALVLRLLEKEPDARPASADEVAEALEQLAAGEAGGSRASRRPLVATAGGLVVVVAMIGGAAWFGARDASPPERATSTTPSAPATTSTVTNPQAGRPAPRVGPWSDASGLRVTRIMRDGDATAHQGEVRGLAVTTAGQLVSGSLDATLRLWDPTTGAPAGPSCSCTVKIPPEAPVGSPDGVLALALTPDGTVLTSHRSGNVARWSPGSAEPPQGTSGYSDVGAERAAIDVEADGRFAVVSVDNSVRVKDVAAASHVAHTLGATGEALVGVGLPGPDLVLVASPSLGLVCRRISIPPLQGVAPVSGLAALAVSPARRTTGYVGTDDGVVRSFELELGEQSVLPKVSEVEHVAHTGPVRVLVVSPSGRLGASASEGNGVVRAWTTSRRGLRVELDLGDDRATALAWAPDDGWLAVGTRSGHVLRVELTAP